MKKEYTCKCGWHLTRVGTRREYALEKEKHAVDCPELKKELELSGKR